MVLRAKSRFCLFPGHLLPSQIPETERGSKKMPGGMPSPPTHPARLRCLVSTLPHPSRSPFADLTRKFVGAERALRDSPAPQQPTRHELTLPHTCQGAAGPFVQPFLSTSDHRSASPEEAPAQPASFRKGVRAAPGCSAVRSTARQGPQRPHSPAVLQGHCLLRQPGQGPSLPAGCGK